MLRSTVVFGIDKVDPHVKNGADLVFRLHRTVSVDPCNLQGIQIAKRFAITHIALWNRVNRLRPSPKVEKVVVNEI